jgi:tocopherol cyclase
MGRTKIRQLWNPSMFQGNLRAKHYFEGWYYKIVDATEDHIYAFIPGVSLGMGAQGPHSFMQWLNGKTGEFVYFVFDPEAFVPSFKVFDVSLSGNHFSLNDMSLSIHQQDHTIEGALQLIEPVVFPKTFLSPGVMGWYTFVPRMQCKHGVVSLNHGLRGELLIDGELVVFDGGRGYIEKDYGSSFPMAYIWMQSNHFDSCDMSFMLSIATIPWFGRSFTGFLCMMWFDGGFVNLSTYRGGRITRFMREGNQLDVCIENKQWRLNVVAVKDKGWPLKSPVGGEMTSRIFESLTSTVSVALFSKKQNGGVVVSAVGRNAGIEMMDDGDILGSSLKK